MGQQLLMMADSSKVFSMKSDEKFKFTTINETVWDNEQLENNYFGICSRRSVFISKRLLNQLLKAQRTPWNLSDLL